MEGAYVRVLVIDDNPAAVELLRRLVAEVEGESVELEHADSLTAGLERLEWDWFDAVLLDVLLPDSHGFDSFATLHKRMPDVPVIVLSGIDDEALAEKMVRDGAYGYLVKGELDVERLMRLVRAAARGDAGTDEEEQA